MLTLGSLCTGYGGFELALGCAGIFAETIWVADNDRDVCTFLNSRHHGVRNLGDLKGVDWNQVQAPDILTAGYPCQPFSLAGVRKGSEDERHLWPHVAEAIRVLGPGVVLLENVPGHRSQGFGKVVGDLAAFGYLGSWQSLRASDIGAPHRRDRVFILATRGNLFRQLETFPMVDLPAFPDRPLLPTPAARLGVTGGVSFEVASGRLGRPHGVNLDDWVALVPRHHKPEASMIWGPAIRRWSSLVGRPTPSIYLNEPGRIGQRPSPLFVEWMMGLPQGWVTEVPALSPSAMLKILGNGVVPLQGARAISSLLAVHRLASPETTGNIRDL